MKRVVSILCARGMEFYEINVSLQKVVLEHIMLQFGSSYGESKLPKILNLISRAVKECLPARYNLNTYHVPSDVTFLMCNRETETLLHALVSCEGARSMWQHSGVGFLLGSSNTFIEWLSILFSFVPAE